MHQERLKSVLSALIPKYVDTAADTYIWYI